MVRVTVRGVLDMESKNKFWKGVLVGALVMAFAGLLIVGVSAGIFLIGKTVMDDQTQILRDQDPDLSSEGDLELDRIVEKMGYIQDIVEQYTCLMRIWRKWRMASIQA